MEQLHTELRAANTLLQRGVKVKARAPLFLRLFGKKTITLTLRQPKGGTILRAGVFYLQTGIAQEQLQNISAEEALALMATHGKNIYKAVACCLLNGWIAGYLFTGPMAWFLRWHTTPAMCATLMDLLITHGGLADFMITTRYIRAMQITAPMLGQTTKGS